MKRTALIVTLVLALPAPGARGIAIAADMMTGNANLIDFSDADRTEWSVINDGVMGGVSQGGIRRTGDGIGIFAGELSLENNGGFASVRARIDRHDLSVYAGLEVRVRGDGRTYQLRLRTDDRFDGIAYRAAFATEEGTWRTIRMHFEEFLPTFRGRTLTDVPPLDASRIHQVGFLLADKRPGPFRLDIDFVRTWETEVIEP